MAFQTTKPKEMFDNPALLRASAFPLLVIEEAGDFLHDSTRAVAAAAEAPFQISVDRWAPRVYMCTLPNTARFYTSRPMERSSAQRRKLVTS